MYDVTGPIQLGQSMQIYLKKSHAKFYPDPIWNDGAIGFFAERHPNNSKKKNKMSTE